MKLRLYLLNDLWWALDQEVRVIEFEGFEPAAIILDEIEQDSRDFCSILVCVSGWLAVGQVALLGDQVLRKMDSNPNMTNNDKFS